MEQCPGCQVRLPKGVGETHRYIGASPACWEIYCTLLQGGDPPLAPDPINNLLVDAYAAQHHGTPSAQAIQSVAVHLLALYGILEKGVAVDQALWIRRRALRQQGQSKAGRFTWLAPPSVEKPMTIMDIVQAETLPARTEQVRAYAQSVWGSWHPIHRDTISQWYQQFVLADL